MTTPYTQHIHARMSGSKHFVRAIGHKQPSAHHSHNSGIMKLLRRQK